MAKFSMNAPIVITGFMGCGKSQVARGLAGRLGVTMVDLDAHITARTGQTPAQLINENGEPAFREAETEALRELLLTGDVGVISLGGGAWIQDANRDLINESTCSSVWLDVPFEVCWARIETSEDDRPLGKSKPQAQTLYERRRPIYQLADIHIPVVGHENLEEIVAHIANRLAAAKRK